MTIHDFLRTLRRKWVFVALGLIAGVVAGWLSAPGEGNRPVEYEATHVLLLDPQATVDDDGRAAELNFDTAALLVTTGDIPDRVAADLGVENPERLTRRLDVTPDPATQSIEITATSEDPERAVAMAQAFGDELVVELVADETAAYDAALAAARTRLQEFQNRLNQIATEIVSFGDAVDPQLERLEAERDVVSSQYSLAFAEVDTLVRQGAPRPPLLTLEQPLPKEIEPEGLRLPDDPARRAFVLGAFGFLLGIAGAVAAQRLDVRVRDKDDLAHAFGVPALAEIPPIPTSRRAKPELLAITRPATPFVEAYRSLRTVVLFGAIADDQGSAAAEVVGHAKAQGAAQHAAHRAKVVLVTSPSAAEGKSTSAAHLAALLGEVGKRVLVVSADFRRPKIHEYFGVDAEPGLTELLSGGAGREGELPSLGGIRMKTDVPNVFVLPSGSHVINPAPFLREAARLIASARDLFDFVVVDSPPVLVANDATELAGVADMVLVLARAGRTSKAAARRAAEALERVGAPVLGAVLIGADERGTAYSYYRNRYYTADRGRRSGRRSTAAAPTTPARDDERDDDAVEHGYEPSAENGHGHEPVGDPAGIESTERR